MRKVLEDPANYEIIELGKTKTTTATDGGEGEDELSALLAHAY
jgi:hypothetical protein